MAHELLTLLLNRDEQLHIAGKMLIPLTHANEIHRIQTLVWINTIGGTEIYAPEWKGFYISIPTKGTAQVFSHYYNQVHMAALRQGNCAFVKSVSFCTSVAGSYIIDFRGK